MVLDAGVISLYNLSSLQCSDTFTPRVTLKNYGLDTLTSTDINYKIDNGTLNTQAWVGSLTYGDTIQVDLPLITSTGGSHTFTVSTFSPNSATDQNTNNDSKVGLFSISTDTVSVPLSEGFTNTSFPPTNWIRINPDAGATWSRKTGTGGFGNSTSCAKMDFYNSSNGNIDDLIVAPVDLSSASSPEMAFNVAYARFSASYSDRMQVQVSTNCGATWTTVWDKQSTALATAPDNGSGVFTPSASQWRTETINLSPYLGEASVFIKFHAISGYGNCCYIDDVNISGASSIDENTIKNPLLEIYPNPFCNNTNIEFTLFQTEKVSAIVYNLIGEKVWHINESSFNEGKHQIYVNGSNLTQGIYYLNINIGNSNYSKKLIIVK